jgi:hypothetical protein
VLHCLLSETATTAAFFVSFWFWVGLVGIAGQAFRANGGTLMAHAGNFVLALAQLLLTRLPMVSTHFQVCELGREGMAVSGRVCQLAGWLHIWVLGAGAVGGE